MQQVSTNNNFLGHHMERSHSENLGANGTIILGLQSILALRGYEMD